MIINCCLLLKKKKINNVKKLTKLLFEIPELNLRNNKKKKVAIFFKIILTTKYFSTKNKMKVVYLPGRSRSYNTLLNCSLYFTR